jgi:hypothetical protein
VTRDMDLIRELLLKMEALPMRPGAIEIIPPGGGKIAVPGYDAAQIDSNLSKICQAGFIDDAGFRPYVGTAFRSLTRAGHDFLDSVRDPPSPDETLPHAALAEIRAAVAEIKAKLPANVTSNAVKAEIDADIAQIEVEADRPTPRRRFMKLYLEILRDNLAKAAGAGTATALITAAAVIGGLLLKHFGAF